MWYAVTFVAGGFIGFCLGAAGGWIARQKELERTWQRNYGFLRTAQPGAAGVAEHAAKDGPSGAGMDPAGRRN